MEYHEESFWAGVVLGKQLKGWGTYGRPEGFDPDGDLILRPITQGIGRIHFGTAAFHGVRPFVDIVEPVFPVHETPVIVEVFGRVRFESASFGVQAIAERLVLDEVVKAFTISEEINPLDYDEDIVYINNNGAFTIDQMTRTFTSVPGVIDVGTMQEVTVSTEGFVEVTGQEVTK